MFSTASRRQKGAFERLVAEVQKDLSSEERSSNRLSASVGGTCAKKILKPPKLDALVIALLSGNRMQFLSDSLFGILYRDTAVITVTPF